LKTVADTPALDQCFNLRRPLTLRGEQSHVRAPHRAALLPKNAGERDGIKSRKGHDDKGFPAG
jgi:hypothetical protein